MNYNGYKFDFACDPIITDEPDDNNPNDPNQKDQGLEQYNASKEKFE